MNDWHDALAEYGGLGATQVRLLRWLARASEAESFTLTQIAEAQSGFTRHRAVNASPGLIRRGLVVVHRGNGPGRIAISALGRGYVHDYPEPLDGESS